MDKTGLLGQIDNIWNSYILGLFAFGLFNDPEILPIVSKKVIHFNQNKLYVMDKPDRVPRGRQRLDGNDVASLLKSKKNRQLATQSLLVIMSRTLIAETYEAIKYYAQTVTKQKGIFVKQKWWRFAWHIRNTASHSGLIECKKKSQETTWDGVSITMADDGKEPGADLIGFKRMWKLHQEMRRFVRDVLK